MKASSLVMIACSVWFFLCPPATLAGPFGPPQPITRGDKGIHTAIGYWHHEGIYGNGAEQVRRENQLYSELGYGVADRWEVYGRVGWSTLKIGDAFSSTAPATITDKNDFADQGGVSGTIGAKVYFPLSGNLGVGTFVQGGYYFRGFADEISGVRGGAPFRGRVKIDRMWEVNLGVAVQALGPYGIKAFIGPYFNHSEAEISPYPALPDVAFGLPATKRKATLGGAVGLEIPLTRGFRLNMEGQFDGRLSFGGAVIYAY